MTNQMSPANITLSQLGSEALALLGAKRLFSDNEGRTLRFNIGSNVKGVQLVEITLDPSDTYTMRFTSKRKVPGKLEWRTKVHAEVAGVYVDSMHDTIERKTGLYCSIAPRRK